MSFMVFVAPFFRWPFTVLFFFTSRSFLAPYRVRLLESVSLIHRGSAFSSHLACWTCASHAKSSPLLGESEVLFLLRKQATFTKNSGCSLAAKQRTAAAFI